MGMGRCVPEMRVRGCWPVGDRPSPEKNEAMRNLWLWSVFVAMLMVQSCQPGEVRLEEGMTITRSCVIAADTFRLDAPADAPDSLWSAAITIEGDNIVVDFNGAVLIGTDDPTRPDLFRGTAIRVKGSNVTIKNVRVHGYKVGLIAQHVDTLRILDSDFSYNYRQRLYSTREKEDLRDWIYMHHNDRHEWLRYGAAIYLHNCDYAVVRGVHVTGGQNGLLMRGCDGVLVYNNTIQFNSGVGIGMYRCTNSRIMHNKVDWNVRGYSHGFYARGQDSAGILLFDRCMGNVIAYNSATHSGDGFFLWAGQYTMDTGLEGSDKNLIYANDFSYAPTNGVEVTFSETTVAFNKMHGCKYGIWGGYSHDAEFVGNDIRSCTWGIAIEHGQRNLIRHNYFEKDSIGIKLWERPSQPEDWGYSKKRDVSSFGYTIEENLFKEVAIPLQISNTDDITFQENIFYRFRKLWDGHDVGTVSGLPNNDIYGSGELGFARALRSAFRQKEGEPPSVEAFFDPSSNQMFHLALRFSYAALLDGMKTDLPENHPKGRQYIIVNEWGPYDFRRPIAWLREVRGDEYVFVLLGPHGNWKAVDGEGWTYISAKTGTFPATFVARRDPDAEKVSLQFEFIGEEVVDQFGRHFPKGTVYPFGFEERGERRE